MGKRYIEARKSRPRRVTIKDVATHAGVSQVTAARILAGSRKFPVSKETEKLVLGTAKELNYQPNRFAQLLRGRQSHIIGLCIRRNELGDDPLSPQGYMVRVDVSLSGITKHPENERYNLMLIRRNDADPKLEELINRNLCYLDGMLFMSPHRNQRDMLLRIARQLPLVVEDAQGLEGVHCVSIDQNKATINAVELLAERGFTRLGLLVQGSLDYYHAINRVKGFRAGMSQLGLDVSDKQIATGCQQIHMIYHAMKSMLREVPDLDGVIVPRDLGLVESIEAAKEAGRRIGKDFGVVSLNETELCRLTSPGITAMRFPIEMMTFSAFNILLQEIENPQTTPIQTLLPGTLNERESTRPYALAER